MLNKLSIQEFERIADETAEESIKDIYRACEWALDGYEMKENQQEDFNKIHGTLAKAVTKRIAIKMGVTKEYTK